VRVGSEGVVYRLSFDCGMTTRGGAVGRKKTGDDVRYG
jgi:hypothetical protein